MRVRVRLRPLPGDLPMPTYQFTITGANGYPSTVTVAGEYAVCDAQLIAYTVRAAHSYANLFAISDPVRVDPAPADAEQPATDSGLGEHSA